MTSMPGSIPPAEAVQLRSLVSPSAGAIVSRTLARTAGGSVTLFAFDAGQSLFEHTSPFDAWVQVLDGALELTIGGATVPAAAGDLVLMPANVPHGLGARQPTTMLLVMLRDAKTSSEESP